MNWELAGNISDSSTVEGKIFQGLKHLEEIRKSEKVFVSTADTWTIETWDPSILCIGRYYEGEKVIGLFNFSGEDKTAWINETDGDYVDLVSGTEMKAAGVGIPAYGYYYLKKKSWHSSLPDSLFYLFPQAMGQAPCLHGDLDFEN